MEPLLLLELHGPERKDASAGRVLERGEARLRLPGQAEGDLHERGGGPFRQRLGVARARPQGEQAEGAEHSERGESDAAFALSDEFEV